MGTWPARLRGLMKQAHVIVIVAALLLPGGIREALWGMLLGSGALWLVGWGYL